MCAYVCVVCATALNVTEADEALKQLIKAAVTRGSDNISSFHCKIMLYEWAILHGAIRD